MANDFIKAEKVVRTSLGLLEREVALPRLVWRDSAIADTRLAKGDTITVRLPAYFKANKRALRSGDTRKKSSLNERAVPVKLTTDVYGDIPITDEQLNLDIENFGDQVLNPVLAGMARGLEEEIAETITGATYAVSAEIGDSGSQKELVDAIAFARESLNKANVPAGGRTLLVGPEVDTAIITSDLFRRFDQSGSADTLRDASIGSIYGFTVVTSNLVAPGDAYAFHNTAYAMTTRVPLVPAGAPWGSSYTWGGFGVRAVRVLDPDEVEDRFITDSWIGTTTVSDQGEFNDDGVWEPAEKPEEDGSDEQFIRAVKLTTADPS